LRWGKRSCPSHLFFNPLDNGGKVLYYYETHYSRGLDMVKIATVLFLTILFGTSFAGAEQADTSETYWDWLGVGPIYSYGDFIPPYYPYYLYSPYYYPAYRYTPHSYSTWPKYTDTFWYYPWSYGEPYNYYSPYFAWKYPTNAWWIGTHGDLQRTLAIARSSSSVRVYSNGLWQTP
jgi:hypothetical protein